MKLKLNLPYIVFAGIVITSVLMGLEFMVLIYSTVETQKEVLYKIIILFAFPVMLAGFWLKIARDAKVRITDHYVSMPSITFKEEKIFWKYLERIHWFRHGLYLHSKGKKIMITPAAYVDRKQVIEFIESKAKEYGVKKA